MRSNRIRNTFEPLRAFRTIETSFEGFAFFNCAAQKGDGDGLPNESYNRSSRRADAASDYWGECCTLRYRIDITRANQKPLLHITRTNHLAHLAVFDIVINLRRP